MLILDTDDLPGPDRVDAYNAAAVGNAGACSIEHEPDVRFHKRMEVWHFGPVVLFSNSGSGMRYWQTEHHLRMDHWNTISLFNQARGEGGFVCNDRRRRMTPADLAFTCKSAGYWEARWTGTGENIAFMLDARHVDLPESMVHNAMFSAERSDIAPLLLSQLRTMRQDAEQLSAQPGLEAIGDSIVSLVRALVASSAASTPVRRAVAEETRLVRVLAYLRAHLADPGLTPARAAAVHNLSLAALRRLFDDDGLDPEQWITHQRLQGARDDLASPDHAHRTIESIGRVWGFANAATFAGRFRQAYGCTPREWRERHH
ncbi:helix-turn-helix domain-containing protein [Spirillospora sp. NPDC050679]